MESKKLGAEGEMIASKYLESKGFSIVERNWRSGIGEIDLIAKKSGVLHVVEVKSATVNVSHETSYSEPEEMLDARKIRKLTALSQLYVKVKKTTCQVQIDAVTVRLDHATRQALCRYYPNILG